MSKIVVFTNSIRGLRSFRIELMEKLCDCGYDVSIYCPKNDEVDDFEKIGCKVKFVSNLNSRGMNIRHDIKLFFEYISILKKEYPDAVLTYTIKPNIYGGMACAIKRVPYIANITGLGTAVENGGVIQKLTVLLYKLAFCRIKKVFFQNTENMQFFIKKKIAKGKHELLPGSGVNLERFSYEDYPPEGKTEFAFISRIMKEKGADQYLDAAEYIKEKYPDTVFHVCGNCEENYEERLRDMHDRGVVIYHGRLSDVRVVLRKVHCVVHPTYYPEGMSNVLLESSATGRPIITTNRSGCREVIDEGVNGFIVEQKNTEDVISKIEKFLSLDYESRKNMGKAGREKVQKEFDRNIVIGKYMEALNIYSKKVRK